MRHRSLFISDTVSVMAVLRNVALLSCLFLVTFAGDDDYVRFTLEGPAATPYHTIRYEITRRGRTTTAVHRRNLPGLDEGLHALGLLTRPEADAIFDLARVTSATSLPDALADNPFLPTWRCDLLVDGKTHTFRARDLENLPDRRYRQLFSAVKSSVMTNAGDLPFRNVFFPAKDRGWLNIETIPAARVFIDGFDTRLETPMYAYELGSGPHKLKLRSTDGRFERELDIKVEPQGTTTLRVDLR